jgi:hypothetical protein
MKKSINYFQTTFELLIKVYSEKLNKTTQLETFLIFLFLRQLPSSFGMFQMLQYTGMKKEDTPLQMTSFLNDLERELCCQQEAATMTVPAPATTLAVSQQPTPPQQPAKSATLSCCKGPRCENGVPNPAVTSHTKDRCHSVHPELAITHFQAALDQAKACMAKRAILSAQSGISDSIILNSGATGHYLKNCSYFTSL